MDDDVPYPSALPTAEGAPTPYKDGVAIANGQWLDPALWLEWKDTIPATQPVIIYCAHGHELSQGLAATLRAMGIDARYLLGGIEAWRSNGQSVESIKVHDQPACIL
nr:rhodanese-like domain-containing protein [Achromobacter sp. MY14]